MDYDTDDQQTDRSAFPDSCSCPWRYTNLYCEKAHPHFIKVFDEYDNLNNSVQENVNASRVVKAFVREDYEIEKFHGISRYVYNLFTKAEKIVAWNSPVMMFVMYTVIIIIVAIGGRGIVLGGMETGELTSIIVYALQILMSLNMVTFVFVMIMIAEASTDRIVEVLDEVPEMQDKADAVKNVADGSIDFNHVDFSYAGEGGNLSLKDVNLHIKSGQTVGIIGGTGSAKSTLVQLIPRLYDVTKGNVQVGGVDVRNYNLEVLRDQVSMVLQKMCCSQEASMTIFAGVMNMPVRKKFGGSVSWPRQMDSSVSSRMATIQ